MAWETKEYFREHLRKIGDPWESLCDIILKRLREATENGTCDATVPLGDLSRSWGFGMGIKVKQDAALYFLTGGERGEVMDPIIGEPGTDPFRINAFIKRFIAREFEIPEASFELGTGSHVSFRLVR